MISKRLTILFSAFFLTVVVAYGSGRTEEYDETEPLEGAEEIEFELELGFAEISLRAGDAGDLFRISGTYDPEYSDPQVSVIRRGKSAFVSFDNNNRNNSRDFNKFKDSEINDYYEIRLSPKPKTSLDMSLGLGECDINLDKLQIDELKLESGLSEVTVGLERANEIRAKRVSLETGLGELKSYNLGFLRFDRLNVESGLGDVDLDLRGFEGEAYVSLSIGLGSCDLTVPKDAGVRVYYKDNFMSSIELDGFDKRTSDTYQTDNWDSAKSHIEIDASIGMGSLNVFRRR